MKNLVQWKPFSEFDRIAEDSVFPSLTKLGLDLAIDLYEEKGNVVAHMNLPGIKTDDIEVTIENDVLTISGSRQEEHETEDKDYYSKEIRRGSFSRSVSLPYSVEAAKAKASYKDGILTVTMPSVPGEKGRAVRIEITKA